MTKNIGGGQRVFESSVGDVTIPDEEETQTEEIKEEVSDTTHEEMQWLLLKLGSDMGLEIYVARNDRNKRFNGKEYQT